VVILIFCEERGHARKTYVLKKLDWHLFLPIEINKISNSPKTAPRNMRKRKKRRNKEEEKIRLNKCE
jgi:hypothetical protein